MSKVMTMKQAVARLVRDGDLIVMEGFTHLIPFAAGHEIIRQRRKNLTLARLTPDLIYDQLIAAGCAKKMIFSWAGNPGVGPLHAFRRAVEKGTPAPLEIEEYTHFGMVLRFMAGASNLPFLPTRNYPGTDLTRHNPGFKKIRSPYTDEELWCVPALTPDVTVVHAQRADADGNTQVWGLYGVQKEAAFASRRVIVTVEEIVESSVIRSDPNRTIIPGTIVNAVVHEPFGAHPSFVQGGYDRDNDFYVKWDSISRDAAGLQAYLDEWVYGLPDRAAYTRKMAERRQELQADRQMCAPVNYGF
jgi:glutaconate CoA-transferase, subunit A